MNCSDDSVQVLIDYLGKEDANTIMEKLGGDNYRVPVGKDGTLYTKIKGLLGQDLADRFIDVFHGEELYIPLNFKQKIKQKRNQVVNRHKELVAPDRSDQDVKRQISSEMGISVRHVSRILSQAYYSKE